jgi:hypothetical protein
MNKNIIASIFSAFVFFAFSCKQGAIEASNSKGAGDKKTTAALASISSIVQPADSLHLQATSRYTKRSCCVGAPSRFRTTGQLAKNETK